MLKEYSGWLKSLCVACVSGGIAKVYVPDEYYIFIGIIGFVVAIFISNRNKTKKKNSDDYFPELKRNILKRIVLSWAVRHRGLKTVVLFGRQTNYPTFIKYIVYCEFKKKKEADRFEIELALQPANLIPQNFIEAYKDQTPRQFQYDWWLETKREDWMKRQPFWLLYKK